VESYACWKHDERYARPTDSANSLFDQSFKRVYLCWWKVSCRGRYCIRLHPDADTNSNADSHAGAYSNADYNSDTNADTDCYANTEPDSNADYYADAHTASHADSDAYS
jgi:hypothetical protein